MLTKNIPGFNLLEIMLTVAMITLIAGIFVPIAGNVYNHNNLENATQQVVQNLRRAQTLARASEGSSDWGVFLSGSSSTIFQGTSYATRNTNFSEQENLNGNALASGLTEIVFGESNGFPKTIGTITITIGNENKTITINEKGFINY